MEARWPGPGCQCVFKLHNGHGWQTGTRKPEWESVSDRATRAETELSAASFSVHIVNFNRVRHPLQLSLASYGMDGKWCLVLEEEPPCDSDGS